MTIGNGAALSSKEACESLSARLDKIVRQLETNNHAGSDNHSSENNMRQVCDLLGNIIAKFDKQAKRIAVLETKFHFSAIPMVKDEAGIQQISDDVEQGIKRVTIVDEVCNLLRTTVATADKQSKRIGLLERSTKPLIPPYVVEPKLELKNSDQNEDLWRDRCGEYLVEDGRYYVSESEKLSPEGKIPLVHGWYRDLVQLIRFHRGLSKSVLKGCLKHHLDGSFEMMHQYKTKNNEVTKRLHLASPAEWSKLCITLECWNVPLCMLFSTSPNGGFSISQTRTYTIDGHRSYSRTAEVSFSGVDQFKNVAVVLQKNTFSLSQLIELQADGKLTIVNSKSAGNGYCKRDVRLKFAGISHLESLCAALSNHGVRIGLLDSVHFDGAFSLGTKSPYSLDWRWRSFSSIQCFENWVKTTSNSAMLLKKLE